MKDEKQIQTEYGDCYIRSSSDGVELLAHAEYGDTVARLGDVGAKQLRDWLNAKYPVEALATQPVTIKLPDRKRTDHLPAEYKTMTPTRASMESYNRALDDVAALNAVRGAEHE